MAVFIKYLLCIVLLGDLALAAQEGASGLASKRLEITADKFNASKSSKKGRFSGNVQLHSGEDFLYCDELVISSNASGKIARYEAKNAKSFKLKVNGKTYSGSANEIVYEAAKKRYLLSGDVQINEADRKLKAATVSIDETTGNYALDGAAGKPVRLIFEVQK